MEETISLFPGNYSKYARKLKLNQPSTRKQASSLTNHTDRVFSTRVKVPSFLEEAMSMCPPTDKELSAYTVTLGVRDLHCDKHYQYRVLIQLTLKGL